MGLLCIYIYILFLFFLCSWIRFIKGNDSSLTDQYPMYSVADESNPNVAYIECLDKLSRAKEMIHRVCFKKKRLKVIFLYLFINLYVIIISLG